MTLSHRVSVLILALLAAAAVTFGAGWIGYQSAHAEGDGFTVVDNAVFKPIEGAHVVAVHAADGDVYTISGALDATVDGKPILLAQADTGSAQALPDAGSASAPAPASDRIHDPLATPAATIDDARQAKRQGWAVFAFFVGLVAARTLGKLGKKKNAAWLAWLNTGRTAVLVGAFTAFVTASYNALADGGSTYAGLYAGGMALATWWNSHGHEA